MGTNPDNQGGDPKQMTAEQIRDATVKATVAELKEGGYLVSKPTGGSNQPGDNQQPDNMNWSNIDMDTKEGRDAFDAFMAENGKTNYTVAQ